MVIARLYTGISRRTLLALVLTTCLTSALGAAGAPSTAARGLIEQPHAADGITTFVSAPPPNK